MSAMKDLYYDKFITPIEKAEERYKIAYDRAFNSGSKRISRKKLKKLAKAQKQLMKAQYQYANSLFD